MAQDVYFRGHSIPVLLKCAPLVHGLEQVPHISVGFYLQPPQIWVSPTMRAHIKTWLNYNFQNFVRCFLIVPMFNFNNQKNLVNLEFIKIWRIVHNLY